jgi:hypothetical protein
MKGMQGSAPAPIAGQQLAGSRGNNWHDRLPTTGMIARPKDRHDRAPHDLRGVLYACCTVRCLVLLSHHNSRLAGEGA